MSKSICLLILSSLSWILSKEIKAKFFTESISQSTFSSFLEIPKAPVVLNTDNRQCVEICLGSNKQCFKLVIQSGSFYLWVREEETKHDPHPKQPETGPHFISALSKTLEQNFLEIEVGLGDTSVIGYKGKDELWINDQKIGKISFLIAKKYPAFKTIDGMIGLGYTPTAKEEKFSFISQLFENKLIYHKVFTQSFEGDNRGELTFGEIPKRILENPKSYGRCKALDKIVDQQSTKNKNWQCAVDGVYVGSEYIPSRIEKIENSKVSFFSYRKRALVPLYFFNLLEKIYFAKYIEQNMCHRELKKRYDTFVCNEKFIHDMDLNFVFGDWIMKLNPRMLFKRDRAKNEYEFVFYHKKDYEKFTLGRPIVRFFHMVYDSHNKEIGFYNETHVQYVGQGQPIPPKVYDYIPDQEVDPVVKPPIKKPDIPINPINPDTEADGRVTEGHNQPRSAIPGIQKFLVFFVVFAGLSLIAFVIYTYIQYRKRTKSKHKNYYQQTEDLVQNH